MKARLCLVAFALLFAGQAMAEEPLAQPKSDPGLPAPPPAATEPAPAPAPQTEAMTSAPEPQKDAATPAPEPQKEAETPVPAPAPQQQAEVPAEVVITELTAVDDQKKLVRHGPFRPTESRRWMFTTPRATRSARLMRSFRTRRARSKASPSCTAASSVSARRTVIITLDRMKLKDGDIVTELTEDQLDAQPAWKK